jgi:hypothetical protein
MAFSMKDISKGVQKKARKLVIYGPPKLGKSTLAGSTLNAIMVPTEDRVAHVNCDKTPVIRSYEEIREIFDFLTSEKNTKYKRVIFDTLDWMEPIIHQQAIDNISKITGKRPDSISDDSHKETNYQKGLKYHAVSAWKDFLSSCDYLRDAGIDVILIAHEQVVKVNPPDGSEYDKYVMKIDKNSLSVIEEWADVIGFYDKKVYVTQEGSGVKKSGKVKSADARILHLSGKSPAMISGNSFGLDDIEVELEECAEIMEYLLTATVVKEATAK